MNTDALKGNTESASHRSLNSLNLWLRLFPFIRYLIDIVGMAAIFILLVVTKIGSFPDDYRLVLVLALMTHALVYALIGVYSSTSQQSSWQSLIQIVTGWTIVSLTLLLIAFVTKTSSTYSRQVFLQWILVVPALQYISWSILRSGSREVAKSVSGYNRSVIIGSGQHAESLGRTLKNKMDTETFVGFVEDISSRSSSVVRADAERILGKIDRLRDIVKGNRLRKIYIALDSASAERVEQIQLYLLDLNVDVIWVPDMRSYSLVNHSIYNLGGNPAVAINQSPLTSPGPGPLYKSLMDKIVALLMLLVLSPLLLVIAIAIKISSPGPVLFKQQRHGFGGQLVRVWKFRSMYVHAEENGQITQATQSDGRVTGIGAILRKSSIDELPQLFNVLQGRMSLVGPRPHAIAHNDYYSQKIDAYLVRHRMKPGITGLAQISGYRGETDTLEKMQKRVEYDLAYINNWSMWLDIKILLKTPAALLRDRAY